MEWYEVPRYRSFKGEVSLKGDKSISHRVLIFSSLCENEETKVYNLGFSDDIYATREILSQLEVEMIESTDEGRSWMKIVGRGLYLSEPTNVLYAYESGTTARIFCPILSSQKFPSVLDGKEGLRKRPMKRVVEPLRKIGAKIWGKNDGNNLPLVFDGVGRLRGGEKFDIPVSSAQVKTALLISNFWADEAIGVREPTSSRDHTERILPFFSVEIKREAGYLYAVGRPRSPGIIRVPGDISSASFLIALSIISADSEIIIRDVSINPTRLGFIEVLKGMGANILISHKGEDIGEPYGDIIAYSSNIKNIELKGEVIPKIIDEIPILSVCAIFGEGIFSVKDAQELRVKETDRIKAICSNLERLNIEVQEYDDGFCFEGLGKSAKERLSGEYYINTFGDHRIAMSFFVLGTSIRGKVYLDNVSCISKSYPKFLDDVARLGAQG